MPASPAPRPPGVADLGFARLDLDRAARTGDPEVVYGAGKTSDQVVASILALHHAHPGRQILATRLSEDALRSCEARLPAAEIDPVGRLAVLGPPQPLRGLVAVGGGRRDVGSAGRARMRRHDQGLRGRARHDR